MAAGTMMLSGLSQRLDLEDAGNPPQKQKITILAGVENAVRLHIERGDDLNAREVADNRTRELTVDQVLCDCQSGD